MANRKFLIDSILGLAQKLGANPNKFMGTKSNINFLGTGDKGMKGTTFSGIINEEMIGATNAFGKSDLVKIIEQDAGYVTAGKLNDVQLNTMFNNLKMIDETFNPPPGPLNVIDLETGTRNINKEGLESLRDTDKIKRFTQGLGTSKTAMSNKIKEGIETLKTKFRGSGKAADEVQDIVDQKFGKDYFDDVATKATAENNFIKSGAADFSDYVSAEGGRRAVVRQLMKNNANYFMLPPEVAESIAKSKDLGKGGSNFPDPLVVFRNVGNFTTDELSKIDEIIEANPFDDVKNIADKVSDYIQSIRPDGFTSAFAEGGRIGYRSGGIGKGIMDLIKGAFGKSPVKKSNVVLNETLTQNETKYLKELIEDTGGGQFTSDIMEEVPSLKIIDNKITIDKKDIDSLSNFLDNMYISDLAPSGRGVDKMPPRLRDTNNNLLIKLLRNEKAEGGRIGFKSGGIGKLMGEGIKTALKRTRKGYDIPGADFQVLTQSDSYLMSPPNMQMLEKLKILRRQLVRDIKRKEGGGKYTFGPDPKGTKKDLQSLDEYIAELKKKIGVEGYYGEGRAAEKALLESDPSLPFSKLVKDRYRSADGGRIGFKSGKSVKDGIAALLKLGNKKFGKDTIKVADDIEPSEFSKFNERNKVLDDLDIEDYTDELGDPETWYTFGMTVREADELVKSRKAYEAQMFTDYKAGRLDPKPGESGRKKFLEKKAEEAEMSGDSRLFTPDEADELTAMQKYGGPKTDDYYQKSLGEVVPDDYNQLVNFPIEQMTPAVLRAKYPGIPEKLSELIGNDTNLQRKAEAITAIEQALALKGAGKSADETIEILKREPKTKMKKGGLAQILEM